MTTPPAHYVLYGFAAIGGFMAVLMGVLLLNHVEGTETSVCITLAVMAIALAAVGRWSQIYDFRKERRTQRQAEAYNTWHHKYDSPYKNRW